MALAGISGGFSYHADKYFKYRPVSIRKKTTALYFMLLNVAQGSGQFSNANENVSIEMENESNWEMQKII